MLALMVSLGLPGAHGQASWAPPAFCYSARATAELYLEGSEHCTSARAGTGPGIGHFTGLPRRQCQRGNCMEQPAEAPATLTLPPCSQVARSCAIPTTAAVAFSVHIRISSLPFQYIHTQAIESPYLLFSVLHFRTCTVTLAASHHAVSYPVRMSALLAFTPFPLQSGTSKKSM